MKRLIAAAVLPMVLSACATDPLIERCYNDVQSSDFPLDKRLSADFRPAGVHDNGDRKWVIIPLRDHQGNEDWLICRYDRETGKLLSTNTSQITQRQVRCNEPCGVTGRWDF